jgi:hypothetical protein
MNALMTLIQYHAFPFSAREATLLTTTRPHLSRLTLPVSCETRKTKLSALGFKDHMLLKITDNRVAGLKVLFALGLAS